MKKILRNILSKKSFQLVHNDKSKGKYHFKLNGFEYDTNLPFANYAPWFEDAGFQKIYSHAKKNTLVDIYRCYELWELTETIHRRNPNASFIEIGVWRGGTASIIARKLSLLNAQTNLFLADTFTGVAKATDMDKFYKGGEHADTSLEVVESLLKDQYEHIKILTGIFPDETGHLISGNEKFGYCHIDVDVYKSAKDIVDWIWDKMIVGGIIIFDDYGFHTCDGITTYVNEQKQLTDRAIIHNLNGHAIMMKLQ